MAGGPSHSPRNWPLFAAIGAAVLCVFAYVAHGRVIDLPGLDDLERRSIDLRFRMRGPRPLRDDRIVIVGLDDKTRKEAPEVFQTRRGWATLVRALGEQHPRAIALDLFFSSPEIILPPALADEVRAAATAAAAVPAPTPALAQARATLDKIVDELRGDEVLAAAVADARVVYLGAAFRLIEKASDRPPAPPRFPAGLEKGEVGEAVGGAPTAPAAYAVSSSLPAIAKGAAGAGAVNHYRDPDGVARRMPLVVELGGHYVASLGLALAALESEQPTRFFAPSGAVSLGPRTIPSSHAAVRINYLGTPFPRVSAADVLAGRVSPGALEHKILLVGFTYAAYDKVPTPFDPLTDGVELHATLVHNLLHDGVLHDASGFANVAAVVLVALFGVMLQLHGVRRRAWLPIVGTVAGLLIWWLVAQLAFERRALVTAMIAPMFTLVFATAVGSAVALATEGREKARLRHAFARYVSRSLVDRIVNNPEAAQLGGKRKELTVLFSDIRGFSRLAEGLPPERLAEFMNRYLTPMTELVLDSEGTLDKYIGDAVMAWWNAPLDIPDHAARACTTGLAMIEALRPLNAQWRADGLPQVQIGVGINTGPMSVGNMGSEKRLDFTVLGDSVNLGARLEALTKEYGVDILVGEATRAAAGSGFVFRELDRVRVVGKDRAARIFQLVGKPGQTSLATEDLVTWQRMLDFYRARDFTSAEAELRALAGRHPTDGPTKVFLERVRDLAASPPGPSWDGVYDQRSK
jgi:adenylate cyclase